MGGGRTTPTGSTRRVRKWLIWLETFFTQSLLNFTFLLI